MAISFLRTVNTVDITVGTTKNTYPTLSGVKIILDGAKFYVKVNNDTFDFVRADIGTINGAAAPGTDAATIDLLASDVFNTMYNPRPITGDGLDKFSLLSAATTNSNNVKATSGKLFGWRLYNNTASAKFVKIYNKATAPIVGTDTPFLRIPVGANGHSEYFAERGIEFSLGIGIGITGAIGDADVTAVAINDVTVNLFYK